MGFLNKLFKKNTPDLNELIVESKEGNIFQVTAPSFEIKYVGLHLTGEIINGKLVVGMKTRFRGKNLAIKRIDSKLKSVSSAEKAQKVSLILTGEKLSKNDFSEGKTLEFD
jgi:hypothetical protein